MRSRHVRVVSLVVGLVMPVAAFGDDVPVTDASAKPPAEAPATEAPRQLNTIIYDVSRFHCAGTCSEQVQQKLALLPGLRDVKLISVDPFQVEINHYVGSGLDLKAVEGEIEALGYRCERTKAIGATVEGAHLRVQASAASRFTQVGKQSFLVVGLFPQDGYTIGAKSTTEVRVDAPAEAGVKRRVATSIKALDAYRTLFQFPLQIPADAKPGAYDVHFTVAFQATDTATGEVLPPETIEITVPVEVSVPITVLDPTAPAQATPEKPAAPAPTANPTLQK